MDKKWRQSIFQLLPLDGRYFLTVALNFPSPANERLQELHIPQQAIEHRTRLSHKNVRIKTLPKLNSSCQSCQVKKYVKGTQGFCNRACLTSMRFHPRHATLEFHACLVWTDESVVHVFSTARWTLQVSISSKENPRKNQKIWWLNFLNFRKNGKTTRANTTCAPVTVTAEIFAYITPICAFSSLSITFALMCPVVKFIFCIVQLKLYQLLYLLTNNILGKIDYAFDLINYVTLLLSSKTIANSPEYCIYTLVMNTYCINIRGIFLPLSLFFLPSFTGHSLQCSHSFPILHFSSAVLVSLPYHYRIKNWYLFVCPNSNIHKNTSETWSHVYYSRFGL